MGGTVEKLNNGDPMENFIKIIELLKNTDPSILVTVVCLFALYVVYGCVKHLSGGKSDE